MDRQPELSEVFVKLNRLITKASKEWPSPLSLKVTSLLELDNSSGYNLVPFLDSLAAFLGSLVMSIYINTSGKNYPDNNFNRKILRYLSKTKKKDPTLGMWIEILKAGLKHFSYKPDFFIPELLNFFDSGIEDPLKTHEVPIKIASINTQKPELLEHLNNFRIGIAHPEQQYKYLGNLDIPMVSQNATYYEKAKPYLIPNIYRLLYGLQFFSNYWLFYIEDLRDIEGEKIADIHLYSSDYPRKDRLNVTRSELREKEFSRGEFRFKLFLAKIKTADMSDDPYTNSIIEVNPLLINWLGEVEREYLPHRFLELKKTEKIIVIREILYHKGEEEIEHTATYNRLKEIYNALEQESNKKKDARSDTRETEEKEDFSYNNEQTYKVDLSHVLSIQRFKNVLKKEYPHREISEEILPHVIYTPNSGSAIRFDNLALAIESLWKTPDKWNILITGDGGMGKTTSFLKTWEKLLNEKENGPIPVFIHLEEYNRERSEHKKDFLWYRIVEEYFGDFREEEMQKLRQMILSGKEGTKENAPPTYIFLLDGFNEIEAVNDEELLSNLAEIFTSPHIQVILSSRSDIRSRFGYHNMAMLTIDELTDTQILPFMEEEKEQFETSLLEELPLLRNPMMLTLYCEAEKEFKTNPDAHKYTYIKKPRYKAEIFLNYFVSRKSRFERQLNKTMGEKALYTICLQHLLPRIGYEMEQAGVLSLPRDELREVIKKEFAYYQQDEFLNEYGDIDEAMSEIEERLSPNKRSNITSIIEMLRDREALLKEESKNIFAFSHQDHRDYFAAAYIHEQLETVGILHGHLQELRTRLLEPHLSKMIGELAGELRRTQTQREKPLPDEYAETSLDHALEQLRNHSIEDTDYRLLNIIEMLKQFRGDLSGTNFSGLDLRGIVLNNVRLAHSHEQSLFYRANWENAKIRAYMLLPQWHTRWINAVCYHPKGKTFVSAGEDGIVKEWRCDNSECLLTYGTADFWNGGANCVCYSPDGKRIAVGYKNNIIREWEQGSNDSELEIYQEEYTVDTEEEESKEILSLCYDEQDGKYLVSASNDGIVRIWDTESGECIKRLPREDEDEVRIVAYNPVNRTQLAVSCGSTIKIWDVKNEPDCIQILGKLLKDVVITSLQYHPKGKKIIAGYTDKTVKEWDVRDGKCYTTYTGHLDEISTVCYSNAGQKILSAASSDSETDFDATIKEWDIQNKKWNAEINTARREFQGHVHGINTLSVNPQEGRHTVVSASYDGTIKEWNLASAECLRTYPSYSNEVHSVRFLDNSRALSMDRHGTISLWDMTTTKGTCLNTYQGALGGIPFLDISSDGKNILAIASEGRNEARDTESGYEVWEIETGTCLVSYKSTEEIFLCFSPDGQKILSTSKDDGTIKEWDVFSHEGLSAYTPEKPVGKAVTCLTYNSDGTRFLSAYDNIIQEWDVGTEASPFQTFKVESIQITQTTIDTLEQYIHGAMLETLDDLLGDKFLQEDLRRILYNLGFEPHEISLILEKAALVTNYEITHICYSPDDTKVLFAKKADRVVEEWDRNFAGQTFECSYNISHLVYSPDGSRIAIGNDCFIDEFETATGKRLRIYEGHGYSKKVTSISYSPNGQQLLSGSEDGTIKLWDALSTINGIVKSAKSIHYKFGLLVQGLDVCERDKKESKISLDEQKILEQYGMIF